MAKKQRIKLSQFAKEQGIAYVTAHRHWQAGNIEGIQLPSGAILVEGWKDTPTKTDELAILYSRVGSVNLQNDLKKQTENLTKFAHESGYEILDIVEEIGTGFSDKRTKFLSILHRTDWNVLIVEEESILMAFGLPYLETLLKQRGQEIIIRKKIQGQTPPEESFDGEYHLISLIRKMKDFHKTIIGYPGQKAQIDQHVERLIK